MVGLQLLIMQMLRLAWESSRRGTGLPNRLLSVVVHVSQAPYF